MKRARDHDNRVKLKNPIERKIVLWLYDGMVQEREKPPGFV